MTKEKALQIVEAQRRDYVYDVGQREYDCLVALIEDGPEEVTVEYLEQFGVEIPESEKCQ